MTFKGSEKKEKNTPKENEFAAVQQRKLLVVLLITIENRFYFKSDNAYQSSRTA